MKPDVTAAVVGSRAEAELMVGMLRDHDVPAWVSSDDAGGVEPALQAQGVRVMVHAGRAADAALLIDGGPKAPANLNGFQRWVVRVLRRGDKRPS